MISNRSEAVRERTVCLPDEVVYREFPSETVVLNLATGKYHALDPVGGRFLVALEAAGSLRGALALLVDQFPDEVESNIEADLSRFCAELAERGLVQLG